MASDNPQPPEPGDCSACIHCYSIIEFAPGGGYQTCDFDSLPADLQEYMLGVVAEMRSNTGRFRRAMDDSRRMGAQVGRTIRPYKTPGTQ